jgi:hypothetical protein
LSWVFAPAGSDRFTVRQLPLDAVEPIVHRLTVLLHLQEAQIDLTEHGIGVAFADFDVPHAGFDERQSFIDPIDFGRELAKRGADRPQRGLSHPNCSCKTASPPKILEPGRALPDKTIIAVATRALFSVGDPELRFETRYSTLKAARRRRSPVPDHRTSWLRRRFQPGKLT